MRTAQRLAGPLAAVAAMVAVSLPILLVPYGGDDIVNRNWALKSWGVAFAENVDLVEQWMRNEGRFFPTAAGYGLVVWQTFTSRTAYTAYLATLAVVLGLLVFWLVWRYTRRREVAVVVILAFACGVQFRFFYDGFISFAGLVPFSLLMSIVATACAFAVWRGRSLWFAAPAALAWSLAITAYEVSLLMLPAILLLIAVRRARSRRHARIGLAALAIPTALDIALVGWLRLNLTAPPAPGYTIAVTSLTPDTAMSQFVAALPLSQHLFGIAPPSCPLLTPEGVALAGILGAATAWGLHRAPRVGPTAMRQHPVALLVAGVWMWAVPALLAGITSRWQVELPTNQGYIYVVYQSLGVALVAAGLYTLLTYRVGDPRSRWIALCIAVALAVAAGLTAGTNLDYAQQMAPGPEGPDWALIGGKENR